MFTFRSSQERWIRSSVGAFARLVFETAGEDRSAQVRLALSRATQRRPTEQEVQRGVSLIDALVQEEKTSPRKALKYFCLLTLNLNEFLYLD